MATKKKTTKKKTKAAPRVARAASVLSTVHCPACEWQPRDKDRWTCSCGFAWNVFETRGVCPECKKKQAKTACLSCKEKAPHADWYAPAEQAEEEEDGDEGEEEEQDSGAIRAANAAFLRPLTPSAQLARIIGAAPLARTAVIKKVWDYIKKHKLQDKLNKRMIHADAALREVLGADQVSLFELVAKLSKHLS